MAPRTTKLTVDQARAYLARFGFSSRREGGQLQELAYEGPARVAGVGATMTPAGGYFGTASPVPDQSRTFEKFSVATKDVGPIAEVSEPKTLGPISFASKLQTVQPAFTPPPPPPPTVSTTETESFAPQAPFIPTSASAPAPVIPITRPAVSPFDLDLQPAPFRPPTFAPPPRVMTLPGPAPTGGDFVPPPSTFSPPYQPPPPTVMTLPPVDEGGQEPWAPPPPPYQPPPPTVMTLDAPAEEQPFAEPPSEAPPPEDALLPPEEPGPGPDVLWPEPEEKWAPTVVPPEGFDPRYFEPPEPPSDPFKRCDCHFPITGCPVPGEHPIDYCVPAPGVPTECPDFAERVFRQEVSPVSVHTVYGRRTRAGDVRRLLEVRPRAAVGCACAACKMAG